MTDRHADVPSLPDGDGTRKRPPPRAVWLSVDPKSGELQLYPREAAQLLEVAFCHGRSNVSLASVEGPIWFRDATVDLHCSTPMHRAPGGRCRDVRRLELRSGETCIQMHVVDAALSAGPSIPKWRASDFSVVGVTQERSIEVRDEDTVESRRPRDGLLGINGSQPLKPAPFLASLAPTLDKLATDAGQVGEALEATQARQCKLVHHTAARSVALAHGRNVAE